MRVGLQTGLREIDVGARLRRYRGAGIGVMDAPNCKLCGKRHYGLCALDEKFAAPVKGNQGAKTEKKKAAKKSAQPVSETIELEREEYEELRRDASLWRQHRNKRREYMRDRRAK